MIKEPDHIYTNNFELNFEYCDICYKHGRTVITYYFSHNVAHVNFKC